MVPVFTGIPSNIRIWADVYDAQTIAVEPKECERLGEVSDAVLAGSRNSELWDLRLREFWVRNPH